jgi:hypothetical protein
VLGAIGRRLPRIPLEPQGIRQLSVHPF